MSSIDGSGGLSGRQLRTASMRRRPGRYQEDDGPVTADRPIFVHPDIAFRADLTSHCAFPSLPFDYPGPGPSEIWKAQRITNETATTRRGEEGGQHVSGDGETDVEEHDEGPVLIIPSMDSDGEDEAAWRPASRGRCRDVMELQECEPEDVTDPDEAPEEMLSEQEVNEESEVAVDEPPGLLEAVAVATLSASPTDPPQELQRAAHEHPSRYPHAVMTSERETCGSVKQRNDEQSIVHMSNAVNKDHEAQDFPPVSYHWAELSPGIQYVIIHELIQGGMTFTRAVKQLGLSFSEALALIEMTGKEKLKRRRYKETIREHANSADFSWLDDFVQAPDLAPVNDTITADEVKQAKGFLTFMGLSHLAARLEDYYGTGGDFLSIPINHLVEDGWRGLFPHFNVLCGEDIQQMLDAEKAESRRRPQVMSKGEMFVRMDPPPGTTNPRRVDHRLHVGSAAGQHCRSGNLPMGLHPENFVVRLENGKRYSIFDPSPWPQRAALEDAGRKVGRRLQALTANSEAPESISYLNIEDVTAMQSLSPAMNRFAANIMSQAGDGERGEHGKAGISEKQAIREEQASDNRAGTVLNANPLEELAPGQQEPGARQRTDEEMFTQEPGEKSPPPSECARNELHNFLANNQILLTRPPPVQGRDQELEASVNSILARHARNVRFDSEDPTPTSAEPQPRGGRPSRDEDGEYVEDLDPPQYYPDGRRKQRYPEAKEDDEKDDDWEPGRARRRSRAPRTALENQKFVVGPEETLLEQPRRRRGRPPKRPRPTPASFGAVPTLDAPVVPEKSPNRTANPTVPCPPSTIRSAQQPGLYTAARLAPFPARPEAVEADMQPASMHHMRPAGKQLDQHGQPVKRARSRRKTDGETGGTGEDNKRRRYCRANRSSVDPSARMQSTEGVVLTREEFNQAHRPEEWKYYPGGPNGGGRFEILATGVMWHFLPREGEPEKEETRHRKRPRSEDGASETRKRRRKTLTESVTPGQNLADRQRVAPLNAIAAVPDPTGCAAPAASAVSNITQASRLDRRLRQMGLPTRDTFQSDDAFRSFLSGIPSALLVDACHPPAGDDSEDPFGVNRPAGCG
ncbi:hypothetical protein MFIFM68171_06891 [Madurella fahalii]|uniref:Uncharacterized protein n=1 Tax=Madurella fahalii TaxID=1157608 RepID=A0ABQ0GFY7_9PEZI